MQNLKKQRLDDWALYFSRLRGDGSSSGFAVMIGLEPYRLQETAWAFDVAIRAFTSSYLQYNPDSGIFPHAHAVGIRDDIRGVILLIGHPLPQSETYQAKLVKEYAKGWIDCVEKMNQLEGKAFKAYVSVAHGVIDYRMPKSCFERGSFSGQVYHHAVGVLVDAVFHGSWKQGDVHRLLLDECSAARLLRKMPDGLQYELHDDSRIKMHAVEWDEASFI